jgi:Uncharacterized protein conserved in bacteria
MEKIVGQALRKEREARGVSLADIAAETRISTRFLQALEDEEFDLFPGKFYIHYYIKNYLQACGADETSFFNTYRQHLDGILNRGGAPPPDQYMQKMNYARFRRNRTLLLAALGLAVLALLAYLLLGPPRCLERMAPRRPAVSLAIPPFSSHLLPIEDELCLTRAPLQARLALDAPCWLSLWRGSEKSGRKNLPPGRIHIPLRISLDPGRRQPAGAAAAAERQRRVLSAYFSAGRKAGRRSRQSRGNPAALSDGLQEPPGPQDRRGCPQR